MITDSERQEAVESLRILSYANRVRYKEEFYELLDETVMEPDTGYHEMNDVFERLADLIDRPSIKPEKVGPAYWRCPCCGKINYKFVILGDCGPLPSHNCAYCGAAIVDD